MKRSQLRTKVVQELLNRVSPEEFADVVAEGLSAVNERMTVDAKSGEIRVIKTYNWQVIYNSLNLIKEIWGIEAPKEVEDVTEKNLDDYGIEQIREQRREIEGRIKELEAGQIRAVESGGEEVKTS